MTPGTDYVVVRDLNKRYPESGSVIANLSTTISQGEFTVLFGPNGCGKTTFLRILVGMDYDYEGVVRIDNKRPDEVDVGIVAQNSDDALFPWRNALNNIALPLERNGFSPRQREQAVHEFVGESGIRLPMGLYPHQLSGGQKQLTLILRALINQPALLVLDEPFTSLDFENMGLVIQALLRLWQLTGITVVLVTHDLLSAAYLADRVLLLCPRPTRVMRSHQIDLPRPRSHDDPRLIQLLANLQRSYLDVLGECT